MKQSSWRNRSEQVVCEEAKQAGALVDYAEVNNRHARRAKAAIVRKKANPGKMRGPNNATP